jgi:hypothetical protein
MKKSLALFPLLLISCLLLAQSAKPTKDTIRLGIYVTSIHDIEFKNQEYDINFWMWMDYDFKHTKTDTSVFKNVTELLNSIEIPQAKSIEMKFVDTTSTPNHLFTKVHATLKDNWNIANFPFDHQKLRIGIENALFDTNQIKIIVDTSSSFYDTSAAALKYSRTIIGWKIHSFTSKNSFNDYYTRFGEPSTPNPSAYSTAKFVIEIQRDSWTIFWKMLVCMYIAFFIAYVSFFVDTESIESRLGLSVGALFAVIGNKYIVEASMPESTTFTLVDSLHAITMFFVLLIITSNTLSLKFAKNNKPQISKRLDHYFSWTVIILYLIINFAFIYGAIKN